jgi:hypothetical protein
MERYELFESRSNIPPEPLEGNAHGSRVHIHGSKRSSMVPVFSVGVWIGEFLGRVAVHTFHVELRRFADPFRFLGQVLLTIPLP